LVWLNWLRFWLLRAAAAAAMATLGATCQLTTLAGAALAHNSRLVGLICAPPSRAGQSAQARWLADGRGPSGRPS